ncbi:MAG: IS200/IS605 family accessory protein TnpB-related protein [Thaumarchaeota archaeon]|nr:IS200/IS605 family accessory protein TnpB-related protein [Nitrososphaerota archaeon]
MLHYQLYHILRSDTRFHSKYVYGALECAASKLKLYRKTIKQKPSAKRPYISRNHLILDNQLYKIEGDAVLIPTEPGRHLLFKLTRYVLESIRDARLGNLVVTDDKLIISYSRSIPKQKVSEFIGIDRNVDNITTYDTQRRCNMYNLSEASRIINAYDRVKSKFRRNDARIKKKIFQKYGKLQKNRVHNILHCTSKSIISQNSGIIMEDLKGIRKLYREGNFQGRKFRRKMNSWSFYELQRQVEYKARWLGLSVEYVRAGGTSSVCDMWVKTST